MEKTQDNARMGTRSGLDPVEGEHPGAPFTMGRGFVKVHRSITDWQWYHDERLKSVFLHILVRCNWQDKKWMGMDVPAGTYITSTAHLAEELRLSRSAVVRALDRLRKSGEITTKPDSKWTAITLVNWAKYQGDDAEPGQPADSQRTASEQRADTTKEGKERIEGKERKERLRARDIEWFKAKCKKAVEADQSLITDSERKPFFDYWTEASASGQLRFQGEKYFDFKRRMRTWQQRANAKPSRFAKPQQMTQREAFQFMADLREKLGVGPNGFVESHLIPDEVREAMRRQ